MVKEIQLYNDSLNETEREICNFLANEINRMLPQGESKVWHGQVPRWQHGSGIQQGQGRNKTPLLERPVIR